MKTLDQIAEAAGVTRTAIYKRFQSYGLSVTSLKGEKQGRATVYGEEIERFIILMFQPENDEKAVTDTIHTNGEKSEDLQGLECCGAVTDAIHTKEKESEDLQGLECCGAVTDAVDSSGQKEALSVNDGSPIHNKAAKTVTEQEAEIQELQRLAARLEVDNKAAKTVTEAAEKKAAEAEARAAAAEARAERAEAQNEVFLQQIDKLTDAIRAAEAVQAAQLARLPAPPPEEQRKSGLFDRLRKRIKGGNSKNEG